MFKFRTWQNPFGLYMHQWLSINELDFWGSLWLVVTSIHEDAASRNCMFYFNVESGFSHLTHHLLDAVKLSFHESWNPVQTAPCLQRSTHLEKGWSWGDLPKIFQCCVCAKTACPMPVKYRKPHHETSMEKNLNCDFKRRLMFDTVKL